MIFFFSRVIIQTELLGIKIQKHSLCKALPQLKAKDKNSLILVWRPRLFHARILVCSFIYSHWNILSLCTNGITVWLLYLKPERGSKEQSSRDVFKRYLESIFENRVLHHRPIVDQNENGYAIFDENK